MTTAIIGTGGIGSAIARELASGGEPLRLASADHESARTLAAKIGHGAVAAADNREALQSSSTRPTTTGPARKSSGSSERPASSR
jgi:predicted dinucleotide-binding enzyme